MESHFSFFTLLIFAIIGGLLCILFVILDIVALINKNRNKAIIYSICFVLSLTGVISSILAMYHKTANLFRNSLQEAATMNNDLNNSYESSIDFERQLYKDSIKKFSSDTAEIPTEYFENSGKEEWYRVPMVYPYSLNMINELKYAALKDDKNTNYETGEYDKNILDNISYAAFDAEFLLCRIEKAVNTAPTDNLSDPDYVLFYFKNGKKQSFTDFEEMLVFAKKQGYKGKEDLVPVSEIYYQWF